jgi:hypothetical protein
MSKESRRKAKVEAMCATMFRQPDTRSTAIKLDEMRKKREAAQMIGIKNLKGK